MRVLVALALILNVAWAANIVCDVTAVDAQGVKATTAQMCTTGEIYCHVEADQSGVKSWGCGKCAGTNTDCELVCVGNDVTPCNKEGSPVGPKCEVGTTSSKLAVFCAAGVELCFSPTGTDASFMEYGCGLCPFLAATGACTQCEGGKATACNALPRPDAVVCEVTTLQGSFPASCGTDTPYCFHDMDTYSNTKVWGCGLCPGTGNKCDQCVGSNTPPACNKAGTPQGVTCNVDDGTGVTPVACRAGTTRCFTATVDDNGKDVMKYGCGDTCVPAVNKKCDTCSGTNGGPPCNKGPDTTTNEEVKDDEKKNYNQGTVMMLNTLLLPLLLALWVF